MTDASSQTKDSFLEAYDLYADALFRYFVYRISDRETAKDLMQETFVKTWDYIQKGGDIKNMRAFLYTVASRLTIDQYRTRRENESLEQMQEETGFEPSFDATRSLSDTIDGKEAILLLAKVPEPYGSAVFMRYVEELSLTEIAEITGETENTVAVHIHRGLSKLKILFNHE